MTTIEHTYSADALLLDIEGTLSSEHHVRQVLFPYAALHLAGFLARHAHDALVQGLLDDTAALAGRPRAEAQAVLQGWIDEDRKAPPLKKLQGLIWAEGFARGELRGHIYLDALRALQRWRALGLPLYIYSSGSVQAQKQYFHHGEAGDLSGLFAGHYDTDIGPKLDAASYTRIAQALRRAPQALLFLSDHAGELAAARQAGLQVVQVLREGRKADAAFTAIRSFEDIRVVPLPRARPGGLSAAAAGAARPAST